MEKSAVIINNLYKRFDLEKQIPKKLFFQNQKKDDFYALKDISLNIKKGESFGIIGKNGSGKTTLLKLISGILMPTGGQIKTGGKMLAFLDMAAGTQEEFTGIENIYLYGSLLGMQRYEITKKLDKIIEFAELEKFIHAKLKDYSNGMKLRLIFSVAMANNPDIILIDEILAVGDYDFQRKCITRIKIAKENGITIILVSHDLSVIRELCDRVLFLEKGEIKSIGAPQKVIHEYLECSDHEEIEKELSHAQKRFEKYLKIKKDILSRKKPSASIPFLRTFIKKNNLFEIEKLQKTHSETKAEILDSIDHIFKITNSRLEIYSNPDLPKKNILFLKETEGVLKLFKIKTGIGQKHTPPDFTLKLNLLRITLKLSKDEIQHQKIITEIIRVYSQLLCTDINKHEKLRHIEDLKQFINELYHYTCEEKTALYSLENFCTMLRKNKIYSPSEIEYTLKQVSKNWIIYLDEKISFTKLKIEENPKNKKYLYTHRKELSGLISLRKKIALMYNIKNHPEEQQATEKKKVIIENVIFLDGSENEKKIFKPNEKLKIKINYNAFERIKKPVFGIGIFKDDGTHITGPNTKFHNIEIPQIEGKKSIAYIIDKLPLLEGTYYVSASIHSYNSFKPYDYHDRKYSFEVANPIIKDLGLIYFESKWELG